MVDLISANADTPAPLGVWRTLAAPYKQLALRRFVLLLAQELCLLGRLFPLRFGACPELHQERGIVVRTVCRRSAGPVVLRRHTGVALVGQRALPRLRPAGDQPD